MGSIVRIVSLRAVELGLPAPAGAAARFAQGGPGV